MRNRTRRIVVVLAALLTAVSIVGLGLRGLGPARQTDAAVFTASFFTPVSLAVFVPCANGGAGEIVSLGGYIHTLTQSVTDSAGGALLMVSFNPQGVSGSGTPSGNKYQGTGVTKGQTRFRVGAAFVTDYINNFLIIGQKPGNNLRVQQTMHLAVNANGVVTAVVGEQPRVSCS